MPQTAPPYLWLLAGLLIACQAPPPTADDTAALSPATADALGQELTPLYLRGEHFGGRLEAHGLERLIHQLARPLGLAADKVAILNSPEAHIVTLPDGSVFLTRGLLLRLKTEAQLAGALAYGLAHADTAAWLDLLTEHRDMLRRAARFGRFAWRRDTEGTAAALGDAFALFAKPLLARSAPAVDQPACLRLERAGFDPAAATGLIELLPEVLGEMSPARRVGLARYQHTPGTAAGDDRLAEPLAELARLEPAYAAYQRGVELLAANRLKESEQAFNRALALNDRQALFYVGKGNLLLQGALLPGSAARLFGPAIALAPELFEAWLKAGLAYQLEGDTLGARLHLQRASQLLPHRPEPHFNLGLLYASEGRRDEAG